MVEKKSFIFVVLLVFVFIFIGGGLVSAVPSFIEHEITTSVDGASDVFAIDIDNDGNVDVLSVSSYGEIKWYKNDGSSFSNWTARIISAAKSQEVTIFAIDIDNDGDNDVLSASYGDDKIAWYENDLYLPEPTCTDGLQNGYEEGVDCGWTCGSSCDSTCTPVINNGNSDDKIDVVFVGSGFPNLTKFDEVVDEFIDYGGVDYGLMYYEPFKEYKDRFNFWRVDELNTFSSLNYEDESNSLAYNKCPQYDQVVLLSINPRFVSHAYASTSTGRGFAKSYVTLGCEYLEACNFPLDVARGNQNPNDCQGNGNAPNCSRYGSSMADIRKTFVHEAGHAFGGLADEYNFGANSSSGDSFSTPNCDDENTCDKWEGITEGCQPGCGYNDWYRAYDNTIMNFQYGTGAIFEGVNEQELLNDILDSSSTGLKRDGAETYNLTYLLSLNYNLGNITFLDLDLITGETGTNPQGKYLQKIISFDNNTLYSSNFSFPLEVSYSPPQDWFDENGTQIINGTSFVSLNETNATFIFPYFNNSERMEIYDGNNTLLLTINISQYHDVDSDEILAVVDNCPSNYNPDQNDTDSDGLGDVCDLLDIFNMTFSPH